MKKKTFLNHALLCVKHLDKLMKRLGDRIRNPSDLAELHVALVEYWNSEHLQNIMRLVRTMRGRCQAVIMANVRNTTNDMVNFCFFELSLSFVPILGIINIKLMKMVFLLIHY
uniref:Uncharacterized protein n=1 Tax=Oryzias melastigma TaxID=30732 RepID=A0A3B3CNP0_ORYME